MAVGSSMRRELTAPNPVFHMQRSFTVRIPTLRKATLGLSLTWRRWQAKHGKLFCRQITRYGGSGMRTRAAVLHECNTPLSLEEVELEAPKANEVMVKMVSSGVCHSDLHIVQGHIPVNLPIICGHEGAGIVTALGPGPATGPGRRPGGALLGVALRQLHLLRDRQPCFMHDGNRSLLRRATSTTEPAVSRTTEAGRSATT